MPEHTVGVVLFQLGGPDSPEAIEPFLYNLFCDPDIIDFPLGRWAREPLARLVASKRAKHVAHHYGSIGGRSPLRELTGLQARALETRLRDTLDARVAVAMRYWHPFTAEAIADLEAAGAQELVLLPLYPQYSKTTTGSSLNEWSRRYTPRPGVSVHVVRQYHDHPMYIRSLVEKIDESLARFPTAAPVYLLFSAHGIPMKVVEKGDPYVAQIEETTRLVVQTGGWAHPYRVCYQSKVGSGRWVQPTLIGSIRELAAQGVRNLLVAPVSFVSDHVETLSEINIEAREEAERRGIAQFEMRPALNDSPLFIAALADLVLGALGRAGEPRADRAASAAGFGLRARA